MWRAGLEINGVASRYLRSPMVSATEGQVELVRARMDELGIRASGEKPIMKCLTKL